jgi:hypothetical protein
MPCAPTLLPPAACAPTTPHHTTESIEQERSSPDAFSQQPYYFMELACLLLEHAKACFASNDEYMQVGGDVCGNSRSCSTTQKPSACLAGPVRRCICVCKQQYPVWVRVRVGSSGALSVAGQQAQQRSCVQGGCSLHGCQNLVLAHLLPLLLRLLVVAPVSPFLPPAGA